MGFRVVSPEGTIIYRYHIIPLDRIYVGKRIALYISHLSHTLNIYFGDTFLLQE